jgi:hypothetical protein
MKQTLTVLRYLTDLVLHLDEYRYTKKRIQWSMVMKVVKGKFGKKEEEEQSLVDKLAYATGEMVESL